MRARLASWWRLHSVREQRLLLVLAALAVVVIVWLAIVRPIDGALARAHSRHDAAVIALADAEMSAEAIKILEKETPPSPGGAPIASFLLGQANAAGFGDAHVTQSGADRADIVIDAVRGPAFFGWVATMERRNGLVIDTLTARTNSDATLAVQASFRARAR